MLDKMSQQQRLMLAGGLAIAFFVIYSYFFPSQRVSQQNQTIVQSQSQQSNQIAAPTGQLKNQPSIETNVPQASTSKIIAKIISKNYETHIDGLGRVEKVYLSGENFKDTNGTKIQLLDSSFNLLPLEIRFSNKEINQEAFSTPYVADRSEISVNGKDEVLTLTQTLSSLVVKKVITFNETYGYKITISLSSPQEYFITPGFRPNQVVDGYTFHGAIIKQGDDSIKTIDDGDVSKSVSFSDAKFAAASDRYYTTILANFDNKLNIIVTPTKEENPNIFISGKDNFELLGYIGPKSKIGINAVDERLDSVIEYGFFTLVAKPLFLLLNYIHSILGNWGWSIVLMTILIRLVLYPVTYRGMVSMNKLKELAPKVKDLQAKYKDDKQKLNVQMMDLYKKHGANPMGGCLPILIQIPIFFAIYRVLQNAIELKNAPWIFWVEDLSLKDPYFILPIAMGITMFLQQLVTPANFTDPMQEKIMKFLPLIFTLFFLTFPAGLTLYWFTNNLFSIVQQMYVNKVFARKREEEKFKAKT